MSKEDTQHSIGTIHSTVYERDAIHIAVAPVVAGEKLAPGQRIGLSGKDAETVLASQAAIGIVDPFLTSLVFPGQRFFMFLMPNTITSLKHNWTHPAFEAAPQIETAKSASERWMRAWAMEHMSEDYYGDGEKLSAETAYANAIDAGRNHSIGPYEEARVHIDDEWWSHWEALTGERGDRESYFSCSC